MEMVINKLNSLKDVKVYKGSVLKLFYVDVKKQRISSFKKSKDNNEITIFPYWRHFSSTKEIITNLNGLIELINTYKKQNLS